MKIFLSIKFYSDGGNTVLIREIIEQGKIAGHKVISVISDYENFGEKRFAPKELMNITFQAIDDCDAILIEFSEKGVGLGIEAGYSFCKGKPIFVIAKKGSQISETLKGIAKEIFFYESILELKEFFEKISI